MNKKPNQIQDPNQHAGMNTSNPLFQAENGKWGFWNEVWCDTYGPYESKEEALEALKAYAKTL